MCNQKAFEVVISTVIAKQILLLLYELRYIKNIFDAFECRNDKNSILMNFWHFKKYIYIKIINVWQSIVFYIVLIDSKNFEIFSRNGIKSKINS